MSDRMKGKMASLLSKTQTNQNGKQTRSSQPHGSENHARQRDEPSTSRGVDLDTAVNGTSLQWSQWVLKQEQKCQTDISLYCELCLRVTKERPLEDPRLQNVPTDEKLRRLGFLYGIFGMNYEKFAEEYAEITENHRIPDARESNGGSSEPSANHPGSNGAGGHGHGAYGHARSDGSRAGNGPDKRR